MPSNMLEQEAQMFGFRERTFPLPDIGSQQQIQIAGLKTWQYQPNTTSLQEKVVNKLVAQQGLVTGGLILPTFAPKKVRNLQTNMKNTSNSSHK